MATLDVNEMFAQANFIEVVGSIVPNARIDFQQQLAGPNLPQLQTTPPKVLNGCNDAVASDCSTARTSTDSPLGRLLQAEPETEPDFVEQSYIYDSPEKCIYEHSGVTEVVFGSFGTPESGTPEWTPRHTRTDAEQMPPVPPSWTPETQAAPPLNHSSGEPQSHAADHAALSQDAMHGFAQMQPQPPFPPPEHVPTPQQALVDSAQSCMAAIAQEQQVLQAPAAVWRDDVDVRSWYRVAFLGGIELRVQPSFLAARSGAVLPENEVFSVSAEIVGSDGRIYLRLADGRGWAFDDSALLPHDPSVVRGHFAMKQVVVGPEGQPPLPAPLAGCGAPSSLPLLPAPCSYLGATYPHEQALQLSAQPLEYQANSMLMPTAPLPYTYAGSHFPLEQGMPSSCMPQLEQAHIAACAPSSLTMPPPSSYADANFPIPGSMRSQGLGTSSAPPFPPPYSYPEQVPLYEQRTNMPAQVAGSLRNPAPTVQSYQRQCEQPDAMPLQALISQKWAEVEHGSLLPEQQVRNSTPSWSLPVTSDIPPTWVPSVELPPHEPLWESRHSPQYY